METGWKNIDNQYYYLYPNGQMAVGWTKIDGKWYFFHTGEEEDETAGTMVPGGWKIEIPVYRVAESERTLVLPQYSRQQPSGSDVYRMD